MIFKIDPLHKYEKDVLCLFDAVMTQHQKAITFVLAKDFQKLEEIFEYEKKINEKHYLIFKSIFYGLARYHFFALSLRRIVAYSFIIKELERLGDYVSDICNLFLQEEIIVEDAPNFIAEWKNFLIIFEEIRNLFFVKDVSVLINYLKKIQKKNYQWKEIFQKITKEKNTNKKNFFSKILLFNNLDRCQNHLSNIIEYLILILNFQNFKKIIAKT